MLKPIATPAWLKRQKGRYFWTVFGAFVIFAPRIEPSDFPSVRQMTYKRAIIPVVTVTFQMFSFAPTKTKNKT